MVFSSNASAHAAADASALAFVSYGLPAHSAENAKRSSLTSQKSSRNNILLSFCFASEPDFIEQAI